MKAAALASKELKQGETIDKIISPFTTKDITGENDTLETYDLIPKDDEGKRILPVSKEDFDYLHRDLGKFLPFTVLAIVIIFVVDDYRA